MGCRFEAEARGHEALVLGQELALVFFAGGHDDALGSRDEVVDLLLLDALGDEGFGVDARSGAEKLAERLAEADQVPPDHARLVAVAVAQRVVVVVRREGGVEVVDEGEGAEV